MKRATADATVAAPARQLGLFEPKSAHLAVAADTSPERWAMAGWYVLTVLRDGAWSKSGEHIATKGDALMHGRAAVIEHGFHNVVLLGPKAERVRIPMPRRVVP